jgi:triacylglycerol esterase/lipase EstA (alpha/beta hydrolase family)
VKSIQDAIYNWLTIKIVADARKDDLAAQDTEQFFYELLNEEHNIENVSIEKKEPMYYVHYEISGEVKKQQYPIELIDIMLEQINERPEYYRNYE